VSFLLDTNVVSEWVKPQPDRNVISWLAEVDEDRLFISVISFAEIRRGIELLPAGRRRERLGGHGLPRSCPRGSRSGSSTSTSMLPRPLGCGHGAWAESQSDARVDRRLLRCHG
jgi:PIN domain-containing protein